MLTLHQISRVWHEVLYFSCVVLEGGDSNERFGRQAGRIMVRAEGVSYGNVGVCAQTLIAAVMGSLVAQFPKCQH